MPEERPEQFRSTHARLLERLHAKAEAALWQLSAEKFAHAFYRSVQHRFQGAEPSSEEVAAYLESLHHEDLALACACTEGNEQAWEQFVTRFRPELYAAARAIAGESAARDLADSIYAELYGLEEREGKRRSLFAYFHGRSKLSTWLRAVLAQRHVDGLRAARRLEPLDEAAPDGIQNRTPAPPPDPDRARYLALLHAALHAALVALEPRDRLRLAYYYGQDLTLAEIGRLTGEHEATVSRKLDRTRRELRKQVERALRAERRLSEAQIRLCYEYATQEWPFDLGEALSGRE